ncbi:uncharacterized protein LOC144903669 [Branchiostoma floridae x Branchiostoma belcheri]
MAGVKLSLFLLFLLTFDPHQAGPSCAGLCEVRRTGFCPRLGGIMILTSSGGRQLPCATCNTTGQADENPLGCLPGDLKKLQVAGHSDRSGELKPLPRLGQLVTLILGPGNICTVGRGAFAPVPDLLALSMEKNAIKTVGSWFGVITKLEKLSLSWNEIEEIKENAFQPLRRLEYLELRHNRLRAVEESHFSSLASLRILHLSYNNISRIAGKSFDRLSRLDTLSLDHNKLSFLSPDWLQGLSTRAINLDNNLIATIPAESYFAMRGIRDRISINENPFRCTCALGSRLTSTSTISRFTPRDRLQCSYPPGLSGRKIAGVSRGEMPCRSPTARVSRRDRGTTLVCEVFWEKQPEIEWLDPRGMAVGETQPLHQCGGTVTTRLEHEYPTTQSPEGGKAHPRDTLSLPYIARSTSTLHMNQQAYQCWTVGSFRCVVKSGTTGNVVANLPLTKSSKQDSRHDHTVTTAAGSVVANPPLTAAAYTSTPAQRNVRVTERVVKTPYETLRQDGATSAADKAQRHTVMTAVFTAKPTRQNGRITESKTRDKDGKTPSDNNPVNVVTMVFIYVIGGILAVGVLDRLLARFKKWKEKRKERQDLHRNAAAAIGGMPLQNLQPPAAAPATGNPVPPQPANDDIPDDTLIPPYAETTRLENPMYGADVTGPRGATSASADPRPGPSRPANFRARSQPGGSGTTRAGNAPAPPPRSDRQDVDTSDSHYYPPGTDTTRPQDVPAPLPRTNWYVNSNVSSQPRGSQGAQAERIPDPLPRTHTYINSNVSARPKCMGMATTSRQRGASYDNRGASYDPQALRMEEENVEGPNLYLDLNGRPRHAGSEMSQAEDVPDPLPRTNKYVNSNVSAQRLGMATLPRNRSASYDKGRTSHVNRRASFDNRRASYDKLRRPSRDKRRASYDNRGTSYDPQDLRMDGEEDVEGPNLYLDLNVPPRHAGSEMPQAEEDIAAPLPRTNRYVNSNVTARGSRIPRQMPPARPSSHPQGSDQEEEVEGPNIYLDLNGSSRIAGP